MLSGRDDPGESRMGEISMSGSTRERGAAVIGLWAFHSVLSSLLYGFISEFGRHLAGAMNELLAKHGARVS
jgi:hypothetical protein